MNKKEYTKPQVRKYSVAGATAMFAVSPEKKSGESKRQKRVR